jgi:signal transduction histidine kinase/CheY-like chemotaxis protein
VSARRGEADPARVLGELEALRRELAGLRARDAEREGREARLRESEARFRSIFDLAPVALWEEDLSAARAALDALEAQGVVDLRRHLDERPELLRHIASLVRILDVNEAAVRMTGVPHKRYLLGTLDQIFGGESLDLLRDELVAIFEGASSFEAEATSRTFQGGRLETHVTLVIPPDGAGFGNLLVCTVDVTARKLAEEARAALEARMRRAERLESLGVLAGGLAHDFNNLLGVILGNSRLLQEQLPVDSVLATKVREIRSAAEHAVGLTEQMLATSGRWPRTREPVDLSALVEGVLDLCRGALPPRAALQTVLVRDLPPVEGDPVRLRQVVHNLVANAGEALEGAAGSVTLRTALVQIDAAALAAAFGSEGLEPGEYVCLEVSDTGAGMELAIQARIFEPFFTTKFAGRGLGLAAVLGIVRGHRGAVRIESEPGLGTTMRVWLPKAGEPRAATAQPPPAEAPRGGRLLVVDDDEPMLRLTELFLQDAGFEVTTALGGRAALDLLKSEVARFDGVVLDLAMPDVGGELVLEAVRRARPELPVVVVSGYAEAAASHPLIRSPGTRFLRKPFEPEDLVEQVRAALLEGG